MQEVYLFSRFLLSARKTYNEWFGTTVFKEAQNRPKFCVRALEKWEPVNVELQQNLVFCWQDVVLKICVNACLDAEMVIISTTCQSFNFIVPGLICFSLAPLGLTTVCKTTD
jgi:hypothetical protein